MPMSSCTDILAVCIGTAAAGHRPGRPAGAGRVW